MCVTWQALISALVARVTRDGYRVTREDVTALVRAGVPEHELVRAFAGDSEAHAHARTIAMEVARRTQG
jgi:hypothetical protein